MRQIEERIIGEMRAAVHVAKKGERFQMNLSNRDAVRVELDHAVYRLWNTDVFMVNTRNGEIIVNSGGWRTPTTKSRINALLSEYRPGRWIYQHDYCWYWQDGEDFSDQTKI
jgi:hypothetical protein